MHLTSKKEIKGATPAVVLIPAFNESAVVADIVSEVRVKTSFPVVVINDASTDDTATRAAEAGATVITLPLQLGAWGATQTGLRYALKQGYELAITMDADGQHEAKHIEVLTTPILRGEADVCIGACTSRGSRLRRIAWRLMKHASGLSIDDMTSGFRAYNKSSIVELCRRGATLLDYQDIGVLLLLQSRGAHILDIQIDMPQRRSGSSRIFSSWRMVAYYMIYTLTLGLSKRNLRSGS